MIFQKNKAFSMLIMVESAIIEIVIHKIVHKR